MKRLKRSHVRFVKKQTEKRRKKLFRFAMHAGTVAILTLSSRALFNQQVLAAGVSDSHLLEVPGDTDADQLATWEERVLGYDPFDPDVNQNGIADGIELADMCVDVIKSLPIHHSGEPIPEGVYITEMLVYGIEDCHICGEVCNMGVIVIHNPYLNEEATICFVGLHFLEHGSFSYSGTVHQGRINVPQLARILQIDVPNHGNHQVPVAGDSDGDLITDRQEYGLGYDPFDMDQNDNGISDGVDLGERVAARIHELIASAPTPGYEIILHELDGLEQCHICGEYIHMGGTMIHNTTLGLRYPQEEWGFLPDLALHYMKHGSFDYFGTEHIGRVDINLLMEVLELQFPHTADEHQLPVKDRDSDLDQITDTEEIGAQLNPHDPDQNDNLINDGVDLAKQCKRIIDELDEYESPQPDIEEPYKINRFLKGLEQCHVCGEYVNMGCWEIFNPTLSLSIEVPVIVCHYMEHGTFEHSGDIHGRGRIEVGELLSILELPVECGDLGTVYHAADLNRDCQVNLKDLAEMAGQWLKDSQP